MPACGHEFSSYGITTPGLRVAGPSVIVQRPHAVVGNWPAHPIFTWLGLSAADTRVPLNDLHLAGTSNFHAGSGTDHYVTIPLNDLHLARTPNFYIALGANH